MITTEKEEFSPLYLLRQNQINLFGPIDTPTSELITAQMQYVYGKFKRNNTPTKEQVITLQLNSPGGCVCDGLAIYDTMQYLKDNGVTIVCIGLGMCASMGAVLLSGGSKGYRKVTPHCEVLIHQPLGGISGQAEDIIRAARNIERTRLELNKILSQNTGKPLDIICADTDRDFIMNAYEAKDYGIVDEIII